MSSSAPSHLNRPAPHGPLSVLAWSPPDDERPLVVVATQAGAAKLADPLVLPLSWLGGTSRCEFWWGATEPQRLRVDGATLRWTKDVLLGSLVASQPGEDIADATERGYRLMLEQAQQLGFPHLLRVWNYLGDITGGVGDDERYRRFCIGRARVVPQEPATGYAAATAIGIPDEPRALHLHWLAAARPGVPIENPRQVSAWEYPREYGPVAPGFSRAMLLDWTAQPLLLISGTASVVGHASAHHDALTQLDETLANLDVLMARAAARLGRRALLGPGSLLRVYVRDAADAVRVGTRLSERLGPSVPYMLLHGVVCRRDLLVEIEAVHRFDEE